MPRLDKSEIIYEAVPGEPEDPVVTYRRFNLRIVSGVFYTMAVSLFPIIAIVVLANLHTKSRILGTIAAFTALFAFECGAFTNASRSDIFTANAA
jgi:hypothetical protein